MRASRARSRDIFHCLLITFWFAVTFVQFPYDAFLLYPIAIYIAASCLYGYGVFREALTDGWPLLLFPAWCLVSILWAENPPEAIRFSVQVLLSTVICFWISSNLRPTELISSLFASSAMMAVMVLAFDYSGGVVESAVFLSKNALGHAMILLALSALALMFDQLRSVAVNGLFLIGFVMALVVIFAARSLTAQIAIIVLLVVFLGWLILARGVVLSGLERILSLFALLFVLLLLALAWIDHVDHGIVGHLLAMVEKDATLTGRTLLWAYAEREIAERPLLGVGEGGFWLPYQESADVRRIFEEFYRAPNARFSFHNTYLEIAVHQGLVGAVLAAIMVCWCAAAILQWTFNSREASTFFFFAVAIFFVTVSVTETMVQQFRHVTMIFFIGALYARRAARVRRADAIDIEPPADFEVRRSAFSAVGVRGLN